MTSHEREQNQSAPATVVGCLKAGELRLLLWPGYGMADGGIPVDIPIEEMPLDLHMPNTKLWVTIDVSGNVGRISRRNE